MRRNPKPQGGLFSLIFSVALHVLIVLLVLGSVGYAYHEAKKTDLKQQRAEAKKPIVQAVAVNQEAVQQEVQNIKARVKAKKDAQIAWQKQLQKLADQAKTQRVAEQKTLAALQQKQKMFEAKAAQQRTAAQSQLSSLMQEQKAFELKAVKQQKAANKKLAKIKQQQKMFKTQTRQQKQLASKASAQRLKEENLLAKFKKQQQVFATKTNTKRSLIEEQLKQLEQLRQATKAKLDNLQSQQMHLEEENKLVTIQLANTKTALAQEHNKKQKMILEAQLQIEKAEQEALKQEQFYNQVSRYKTLILDAIGRRWIIPQGTNQALSCQLLVTLSKDGSVDNVKLLKSSGDLVLDRSAITAIYKASPLPVPQDPDLLKKFSEIKLTVQPQGLLNVNGNN